MQRDLVERAMVGDREAFTELGRLWIDRLYAIARLILRDGDRAQDATQEALVAAWRDLKGSARPGSLRTLATPAARQRVLSRSAQGAAPLASGRQRPAAGRGRLARPVARRQPTATS